MNLKDLFSFFNKREQLVAVDIGLSSIRVVELQLAEDGGPPTLVKIGKRDLGEDVFSGNLVRKTELVSEKIGELFQELDLGDRRVMTAMPGPSVFTKRIKMPKMGGAELAESIGFEASNFIPHDIDAVKLDYHVLGEVEGGTQLEVLVVAVKNEIIDSYLECFQKAGLETAVLDVDYFAVQNMFELSHPELVERTVALVNVGARFSSINICKGGASLFTGDISVGGKLLTDAIREKVGMGYAEAERAKYADNPPPEVKAEIDQHVEYITSEFNRQLSFFWNASGAEEGIDSIILCGGGVLTKGLIEQLAEKTGVACTLADPMRGVKIGEGVSATLLEELRPHMGIAIGLGIRQPGDKIVPDSELV